jgi:hypothetical protein
MCRRSQAFGFFDPISAVAAPFHSYLSAHKLIGFLVRSFRLIVFRDNDILGRQLLLAPPKLGRRFGSEVRWGKTMYHYSDYSSHILQKVEDLAFRVHLLKGRMAKQKVSVKLEHYWELEYVRSRFAEFKWRVEQLDGDDELQLTRDQAAIEGSWNDLMHAVNVLLAALSETTTGGNFDGAASGSFVDLERAHTMLRVHPSTSLSCCSSANCFRLRLSK